MADISKTIEEVLAEEPTTAVPAKDDDGFNYNPSGIGGLATLGAVGGAAAYFLNRAPGFGRIARAMTTKIPRNPESRPTVPAVKDQVDEVLEIVPTRMDVGKATAAQRKPVNTFEELGKQIKARVDLNPLSVGGKSTRFGSAAFDFFAKHPSNKPLKAQNWINELSSDARMGSLKVPNTKIRANVTREELEETNIAKFDKDGKLTGGFLKIAQEKNIPVSKFELMSMIEKSPALNLKTKRHFYVGDVDKKTDLAADLLSAKAAQAIQKIKNLNDKDYDDVINSLENVMKEARREKAIMQEFVATGKPNMYVPLELKGSIDNLIAYNTKVLNNKGLELITKQESDDLLSAFRNVERAVQVNKNQKSMPKYGSEFSYRERGSEKYFEDVVYYPKDVPFGLNYTGGHYDSVKNQILHTRYGMRSLQDNPNKKVYAIDEIQSDYSRSIEDAGKVGERLNPFNIEQEYVFYTALIKNKVKQMKELTDKGLKMTNDDMKKVRALDNDIEELKKTTVNAFNMNNNKFRELPPYLPMLERAQYNDYAVKNLIKQAADDGMEWVAVNPVERVHVGRNLSGSGDKKYFGARGNWNVYGGADGKAGMKGINNKSIKKGDVAESSYQMTAQIPEIFKKLAKQYNSEARMIKISKSDPSKPYKIVENIHTTTTANKLKMRGAANERHITAFRTKEEAEAYAAGKDIKFMEANDPDNYYNAFAIKITPEMKGTPFKLYRREGGLVVNLFA